MAHRTEAEKRDAPKARASCRGTRPYKGVVRVGRKIVWECPHWHENRDQSNSRDVSASDCAGKVLRAANDLALGSEPLSKWLAVHGAKVSPYTAQADYERAKWAEAVAQVVIEAIKKAGGSLEGK